MKLLERVGGAGRLLHLAANTVDCYERWVREFLSFHRGEAKRWRHPRELGAREVEAFLVHLARHRRLSASSQNQALNAIVFLYTRVLVDELPQDHLGRFAAQRARRSTHVPTVLSVNEVERLIDAVRDGSIHRLMIRLLYGTGMRVSECCTLRLRDLDFDRGQIIVRDGKGGKDRTVMLPSAVRGELLEQCRKVRARHELDLKKGGGQVPLPDELANKVRYARTDWRWQFLFSSATLSRMRRGMVGGGTHIRACWPEPSGRRRCARD